MSTSAFGVEHEEISKVEPASERARKASMNGMRHEGMGFTDKDARKVVNREGRLNARVIRRGPYTSANRKSAAKHIAAGGGVGAAAGAAVGALHGGGKGAAIGAATGALNGGAVGEAVGAFKRRLRANAHAIDSGIHRGDIKTGQDKKDIGRFSGIVKKSAFGVDHEISKYVPGTITYHAENARMHSRKKASGGRQLAAGAVVAGGSVAAHQNSEVLGHKAAEVTRRSDEMRSVTVVRGARNAIKLKRASRYGIAGGAALAGVGAARAVYHGHKQNSETKRAQGARVQRSAEMEQREADRVDAAMSGRLHKSAFGVEHEPVEKFALGGALDAGRDALRGLKLGLNNKAVLHMAEPSVKAGNKVGLLARDTGKKLKPLVSTPGRAAATAGGAAGGGFMLGHLGNNN